MTSYRFFGATDRGLCRENNEDAIAFDARACLAILADGMGGYNAGEVASSMAVDTIQSELVPWLLHAKQASLVQVRHAMEVCVHKANTYVFDAANQNTEYAGMGTTLVLGVFLPSTMLVGHIGDSRCYRMRQGVLTQLTKDHSLLQEHIDAGLLSQEQAVYSSMRNFVTRALGVESTVVLEISQFAVLPGDIYLLCSDGLSDMVDDSVVAKIIGSGAPLSRLARRLIAQANANGGADNISALLIQAQSTAKRRGVFAKLFTT